MADSRFFDRKGPFSLGYLSQFLGVELEDPTAADRMIEDVASLSEACPETIGFFDNRRYLEQFKETRAGACIVRRALSCYAPSGCVLLISSDPYRTYARVASLFYPVPAVEGRVDPSASVDPSAELGENVRIEAGALIGARARIGARTVLGPNTVIGCGVVLGADCVVGANTVLTHAIVGSKVTVYPGCCIGQDGFGFAMGGEGHLKVPQLGRVLIGDDVEIGANTTIDRGSGPDTVIGSGCRIDNLVQIGHNVELEAGCVIVAQTGIAGSAYLESGVVAGGQVGIAGHLKIGKGTRISAQSGVIGNIGPGETVAGHPARPSRQYWRELALIKKFLRHYKG